MSTQSPLWIEEPDYAAKYGRGVSAGIESGFRAGLIRPDRLFYVSPAFCRGFVAGWRAASRRRIERERRHEHNMRLIHIELRIGAMIQRPDKLIMITGVA